MKKTVAIFLIIMTLGCNIDDRDFLNANGKIVTGVVELGDIKKINIQLDNVNLKIKKSDKFQVTIKTSENVLKHISINRLNNTLYIGESGYYYFVTANYEIVVETDDIESIDSGAKTSLYMEDFNNLETLSINLGDESEAYLPAILNIKNDLSLNTNSDYLIINNLEEIYCNNFLSETRLSISKLRSISSNNKLNLLINLEILENELSLSANDSEITLYGSSENSIKSINSASTLSLTHLNEDNYKKQTISEIKTKDLKADVNFDYIDFTLPDNLNNLQIKGVSTLPFEELKTNESLHIEGVSSNSISLDSPEIKIVDPVVIKIDNITSKKLELKLIEESILYIYPNINLDEIKIDIEDNNSLFIGSISAQQSDISLKNSSLALHGSTGVLNLEMINSNHGVKEYIFNGFNFPAIKGDIKLENDRNAEINITGELEYQLEYGSSLRCLGNPRISQDSEKSSSATLEILGDI